jgi:hypothetical protein
MNPVISEKPRKRTPSKVKKDMEMISSEPEKQKEIELGGSFIDIKTSTIVKIYERLVVQHENGPVELIIDISADFNTIPKKYHEIFLNVMSSKYLGRVNFGNNPFSDCRPIQKRKWYQFWKSRYFNL